MAGLVICAFFVMGVMTGFSTAGRAITLRAADSISHYGDRVVQRLAPAREAAAHYCTLAAGWAERNGWHRAAQQISRLIPQPSAIAKAPAAPRPVAAAAAPAAPPVNHDDAIALVERHDGFYALDSSGGLRGPVSPAAENDLAILSGAALEDAHGGTLVDYTAALVRAETQLSELVSEMRIANDGTAVLYLEHARTELVVDLDPEREPAELQRAVEVLSNWADRKGLIASLDMTVPDEAVVRLNAVPAHSGHLEKVSNKIPATGVTRLKEAALAP